MSIRPARPVSSSAFVLSRPRPPGPARSSSFRTGAFLGIEGSGAFGAASLALLRFTRGPVGAGLLLAASLLLWIVAPALLAARRLGKADL